MAPHQQDRTGQHSSKTCPRVSAYPSQVGASAPRADLLLLALLMDHCLSPRVSFCQCQCGRLQTNPDSWEVHYDTLSCLQNSKFLARPQFPLAAEVRDSVAKAWSEKLIALSICKWSWEKNTQSWQDVQSAGSSAKQHVRLWLRCVPSPG